ncbi:hypothetical protein CSB07_00690 [Candidatus Gracilibacteria bacterium]|nr:MAG: hypothetical protein CSB07_00690 [Candidatus Gracilibacteria bacterium]
MSYSKIQKFVSVIVLFFFFSSISINIPLLNFSVFAKSDEFYDLVSIIVDEKTYSKVSSEIKRYSKDISSVLENTKVVIIPVPEYTPSFNIASINEGLYFDGYKSLKNVDFNSRLVGTIFVGNIALPSVYSSSESQRSVLPYTDFENKSFIYDKETNKYKRNNKNHSEIKPEVWHSFISPNTGNFEEDIDSLKVFFDKDHDFYLGEGKYEQKKHIINGDMEYGLSDSYEPYVFYFDYFREKSGLNPDFYLGYEAYLENKEDLNNSRYTKELAEKLKNQVLGKPNEEIYDLAKKLNPSLDLSSIESGANYLEDTPDIQSRYIINNAVKKFIEVFSKGSIGDMRKNVFNAGRYNYGQGVNVDFIPYFITVLDIVNDEIIKDLESDLDREIDSLVKNGLSSKIIVPDSYEVSSNSERSYYDNFLFGKNASSISEAIDCSFYRGSLEDSGKLVEANRGYNIKNIEKDNSLLQAEGDPSNCLQKIDSGESLLGFWGKNSPFYIKQASTSGNGILEFKSSVDYSLAIKPLFDIAGAKQINDIQKVPNPYMCLEGNMLLTQKDEKKWVSGSYEFVTTYSIPEKGGENWTCRTLNQKVVLPDFYSFYDDFEAPECSKAILYLDGEKLKEDINPGVCASMETKKYFYKTIDSYIKHNSPSSSDLTSQHDSMLTDAMPIDKNPYIDFIRTDGKYVKINYPKLYTRSSTGNLTMEMSQEKLDNYLDKKSQEINNIINKTSDSSLVGAPKDIYNFLDKKELFNLDTLPFNIKSKLTTGAYPSSDFDLKSYLKGKGKKTVTINGVSKEISYYDMMLFSKYWNNLNSVSAKYAFVFENYLSEDKSSGYSLPKHKNAYEIAYLGSKGKADSMFIGLDPEEKGENPYADIISENAKIDSEVFGSNVGNKDDSGTFECAPPDGVPIWKWIPAINCRLKDMLPPTIKISSGACGDGFLRAREVKLLNSVEGLDVLADILAKSTKEKLEKCNIDKNKDGVIDCFDDLKTLELRSGSDKYYLNSNIDIKATLKGETGEKLSYLSSGDIEFELVKVEKKKDKDSKFTPSNTEIIYDKNNSKGSKSDVSKYLDFGDIISKVSFGEGKYIFNSRKEELNVYVQANLKIRDYNYEEKKTLKSNLLKIKIRADRLFLSADKIKDDKIILSENSLVVNDKANVFVVYEPVDNLDSVVGKINSFSDASEKILFRLENLSSKGERLDIDFPINIELYSGENVVGDFKISKKEDFTSLGFISKSGEYSLKVTDKNGIYTRKSLNLVPDLAKDIKINLGSSVIGANGNVSTSFVTLFDRLGNVASSNFYDVKMSLLGDSAVFLENDKKDLDFSTLEGYKVFRISSTDSIGESSLQVGVFDINGKKILSGVQKLKVVEDIFLDLENKVLEVGNNDYELSFSLKDKNGNILSDLNSRVYLKSGKNYIKTNSSYFDVKNGEGVVRFSTKTLAGKNIIFNFQVEGFSKTITKKLDINPQKAIKTDLIILNSKIDADSSSYSDVKLQLKDRYNNTVFTDSSRKAEIEIAPSSSEIASLNTNYGDFKNGELSFKVYSTTTPGIGYFKTKVTPDLSTNSFSIGSGTGEIVINGVSENAGKIETFYFWDKEKIENMSYNSLYTTLLGANYGDIEKKDYLAGALIFDKNSRALAVTSTINGPDYGNSIISVEKTGNINSLVKFNDLGQDISYDLNLDNKKFFVDIYNDALNVNIGKLYYNFPEDTSLEICGDVCYINKKKTSIFGKSISINYDFYISDNELIFVNRNGKKYFSIDESGKITKNSDINFELDVSSRDFLKINILSGKNILGYIGFNFVDAEFKLNTNSIVFNKNLQDAKNALVMKLESNYYFYNPEKNSVKISYNDPFAIKSQASSFSKSNFYSYEHFEDKGGLGWKEGNKTLLSFAAGENVGNSLKKSMSFGAINIGDPVISLKKIRKDFNPGPGKKQFDSTIGEIISMDDDLEDYKLFDYNADGREDVLLVKNDGYLKLLENKNTDSRFIDMGNVAHIFDIGNLDLLHTGDFTGDSYDDIFFVGDDGEAYILNNVKKDFYRISLKNKLGLSGKIIRAEVFDMDNDGKDDIVTLDDNGEINIFYGSGVEANPSFTKKIITSSMGLKLASEPRANNSLVYFDGLYQVGNTKTELLDLIGKEIDDKNMLSPSNRALVESMIFEVLPYSKTKLEDVTVESLEESNYKGDNTGEQVTFIKGEYAAGAGLKVKKTFSDINSGNLKPKDEVLVKIKLTNTSSKKLKNIAYLEKVENYFSLKKGSIENSKNLEAKRPMGTYSFMFDGFSLSPGETLEISYNAFTKNISYSYLKVGLFEKGEAGDDEYGDIIIQESNRNCSEKIDMFRSIGARKYYKSEKKLECVNENALEDTNSNNIPDYIEELMNNNEELQNYSKEKLSEHVSDLDGDGILDSEDFFNVEPGKLTVSLGDYTEKVDDGLDNLENFIEGLSCGFNNGACISSPLNWAPLAAGNDPVFLGNLIGDGLNVDEGIPIFSALTFMQYGPVCGPSVWPISPLSTGCSGIGAGGNLGVDNPANVFRLFISPTITGGIGTAACFGGPASVAGYSNMPGIAPLFPGGNCIVLAKPLLGCSNDGSSGDPSDIGVVNYNEDFGYINGNCPSEGKPSFIKESSVEKFLGSLGSKIGVETFSEAMVDHSTSSGPLFTIGGRASDGVSISFEDIDYSDIEKISQKRISAFPSFLMDWVTRQFEEIATKITSFPTVFVIFPDISGIYDSDLSWRENSQRWAKNAGNPYSEDLNTKEKSNFNKSDSLESKVEEIVSNTIDAKNGNNKYFNVNGSLSSYKQVIKKSNQINSGIKEAYEFIGSLPLVRVEQETIYINVPWVTEEELEKTLATRELTVKSREAELERAKANWTLNGLSETKAAEKISINTYKLINSLKRNIEIIKTYKDIPKSLNELLNKKQERLEQLLCNIEVVSDIVGGWIGRNGERFKAWVELFILIKSILKSWQILIDIFKDYEDSCKECKNERDDSLGYQFSIIDMIVPDIPVVKFPSLPDIYLDLHNIRAGVVVRLPDFDINTYPIIFPELPSLSLPDSPNANIDFPGLPILPEFKLPELPDLPSLPEVQLPDLPPPPKLPKLFAGFEFLPDLLRLVTRAMCILKTSPFVPEWRAGDQIAYLTERNGFLSTDFLNVSFPQFSFPFVDSIRVNTYVNLEYETDFLVEFAKQVSSPINRKTSDFTNIFDLDLDFQNIDFRDKELPDYNKSIGLNNQKQAEFALLKSILFIKNYISENKDKTLTNSEFKKEVFKTLSSTSLTKEPRYDELKKTWDYAKNYSFSKEDKIIEKLQKNNREKFDALKDIINTEIIKTKKLKKDLQKPIRKVAKNNSSLEKYNKHLSSFNEEAFKNIDKFVNSKGNYMKEELEKESSKLKTKLSLVSKKSNNKIKAPMSLAASLGAPSASANSCSPSGNGNHVYEGIYIVENSRHYRLFDYLDELEGDEEIKTFDIDNDGDNDIFYFVNGVLYLKENLLKTKNKTYLEETAKTIDTSNNKFLNNSEFLESVNDPEEISISSSILNISFSSIKDVYNYRLSYYDIIDKYFRLTEEELSNYKRENIVDGIAGIGEVNLISEVKDFFIRDNISYIKNIGNFKGIEIYTDELKSLKQDLNASKIIFVSNGTKLYAGNTPSKIVYKVEDSSELKTFLVEAHTNIEIKGNIRIVEIGVGDLYVKTGNRVVYKNEEILKLKHLPIFSETKIFFQGDYSDLKSNSYLELKYYDKTDLNIDFNKTYSYELYDLSNISSEYLFSLSRKNDYFYAKVYGFKEGLVGIGTSTILSAPQLKSDKNKPDISLDSLKVPVYQVKKIDITDKVFEDSSINSIKKVYFDFDLELDSDGDGNPKNDDDTLRVSELSVSLEDEKIIVSAGDFTELISKKIGIFVEDENGNVGFSEVDFQVYAPKVDIKDFDFDVISGKIDEDLENEPINIYRYRGGNLVKILDSSNNSRAFTKEGGVYDFDTKDSPSSKLVLKYEEEQIANINEKTGKIDILPIKKPYFKIKVFSSEDLFPEIVIQNISGKKLFSQKLRTNRGKKVEFVDSISDISEKALYLNILNKSAYNYYSLPENISYNPGVMILYKSSDVSKKPVVTVFRDGRIKLSASYKLRYSSYLDDYVSIKILDSTNKEVASVIYYVDGEYVIN